MMTRIIAILISVWVSTATAQTGGLLVSPGLETGISGGDSLAVTESISPRDIPVYYGRGNAAYRDGRFAEAAEAYQKAIRAGTRHGAVYYNLGNAEFRLGHIGAAVLNYERALRLDAGNDDARKNLAFVSALKKDRDEIVGVEGEVQRALRETLDGIGEDTLAILFSVGLFGICGLLCWWTLGGRRTGLTVTAFVLAIAMLMGSLGVAGARTYLSEEGSAAIVYIAQAEARFEPSTSAKVGFVLHEGTKIHVERIEGTWALVRVRSGLRGWLPIRSYRII
jgi:tetratricopeptide (TPR) repeat protein